MIKIGKKANVRITVDVDMEFYRPGLRSEIEGKFAQKYGLKRYQVTANIRPKKKKINGVEVDVAQDIVKNIESQEYQQERMKMFLESKGYSMDNWEDVLKIDNIVHRSIDMGKYINGGVYRIKNIFISNFLCFGENNFVDFTKFDGLVLLQSNPENYGGKTTFAINAIKYLLFGVIDGQDSIGDVFNKFSDGKEMRIAGTIAYRGEDYRIERSLTKKIGRDGSISFDSRQVKFFKAPEDFGIENLDENSDGVTNLQQDTVKKTEQEIIKIVGNPDDFGFVVSCEMETVKSILKLQGAELNRKVSRWVGLSVLEEKQKIAKEMHNNLVRTYKSNTVNKEDLIEENQNLKEKISVYQETIVLQQEISNKAGEEIQTHTKRKEELLSQIIVVPENIANMKIDQLTIQRDRLREEYKVLLATIQNDEMVYKNYGEIVYDKNTHDKVKTEIGALNGEIYALNGNIKKYQRDIETMTKNMSCPTCHRPYDNAADIQAEIEGVNVLINETQGIIASKSVELEAKQREDIQLNNEKENYDNYLRLKSKIEINRAKLNEKIVQGKKYNDDIDLVMSYADSSKHNAEIEYAVNNENVSITNANNTKKMADDNIIINNCAISEAQKNIEKNEAVIRVIESELKQEDAWRKYLAAIGQNGIINGILNDYLPQLNAETNELLAGLGGGLSVDIAFADTKREELKITFNRGEEVLPSKRASTYESTIIALALRTAFSHISTLPRPQFVVYDEILGGAAAGNHDEVKEIMSRISNRFDFIFHVSYLEDIREWHDTVVTITKKDNISSINVG